MGQAASNAMNRSERTRTIVRWADHMPTAHGPAGAWQRRPGQGQAMHVQGAHGPAKGQGTDHVDRGRPGGLRGAPDLQRLQMTSSSPCKIISFGHKMIPSAPLYRAGVRKGAAQHSATPRRTEPTEAYIGIAQGSAARQRSAETTVEQHRVLQHPGAQSRQRRAEEQRSAVQQG